MSDEISDRIIRIVAEQAMVEPSELTPEKSLEELGLDSLSIVEIVFGIEEAFDISIPFNANNPEENTFDVSNVQGIIDGVRKLVADGDGDGDGDGDAGKDGA